MKLSWRDCHNYQGTKNRQKCIKCGKIGWSDKEPKCSIRDERTMEEVVIDFFASRIPSPYFYVNVKPFKPVKITVQDLLNEK